MPLRALVGMLNFRVSYLNTSGIMDDVISMRSPAVCAAAASNGPPRSIPPMGPNANACTSNSALRSFTACAACFCGLIGAACTAPTAASESEQHAANPNFERQFIAEVPSSDGPKTQVYQSVPCLRARTGAPNA